MAEVKDLVVQTLDVSKLSVKEYIDGLLQDIETQVKSYVFDPKTPDGRADIISLAYKVSQSKTHIVKVSDKDMESKKKEIKDRTGIINHVKEFLDDLRDETRAPVTEWENEQKRIADEEARKEAEKIDKRIADLLAIEVTMPRIDVAIMTDEEFDTLLFDKTEEWRFEQDTIAEKLAAEEKRLADEKAEREAEAKRLAEQKAEQDKISADLKRQQDELAAQQKAIDDEKARIAQEEATKKREAELKEREAKYAEELRLHDEEVAKAKVALEAKEADEREMAAKEAEERRLTLLPDIEKVNYWLNSIEDVLDGFPTVVAPSAGQFIERVRHGIGGMIVDFRNQVKEL